MSAERRASPDAGPAEQREWWHVLLRLLGAVALAGLVLGALASGVLLLILG